MLIELDFTDLGWALGMVAIAIGLSAWQGLGLEGAIAIAAGRTLIQLILVGYVLAVVFDPEGKNPWLVLAVLAIMLTTASMVASNRISKKIKNLLPLVWGSIFISTALTLAYTNLLILQPDPWYEPQYLIPLAGMILGNAMNSGAIAGERLVSTVNSSQLEIETHLSLGFHAAASSKAVPQRCDQSWINPALKYNDSGRNRDFTRDDDRSNAERCQSSRCSILPDFDYVCVSAGNCNRNSAFD